MKYTIFAAIVLFLPALSYAGIFSRRNCGVCYRPAVVEVAQDVLIESETYIIPKREVRYTEIPNLQIIQDQYGQDLIVIDGKIKFALSEPAFISEESEVKDGQVEKVRRTEVNQYGSRTVIETREIRK